jgi:segregation and condensation protein B
VRIIGKKEEVGRPMLYGTSPEFLRVFNLRDLSELPTLREFYDLSAEDQSRVESEHGAETEPKASATTPKPDVALNSVSRGALSPEPEDTDPLLDELDEASKVAKKALGDLEPEAEEEAGPEEAGATSEAKADEEPPASAPPTTE